MVGEFTANSFDCIVHDPPARALCRKDLYGQQFYANLFRVLRKPGGVLFHYVGNPHSKESGKLFKGIISRLKSVGFINIRIDEAAFGIVAET